jgi:hypothetical protein
MRRALSIVALAVAAWFVSAGFAAEDQPVLRSAALINRHVVVTFTVGDLTPGAIEVALRPAVGPSGAFLPANVVLREAVSARPAQETGLVRWRTVKMLPLRTFYVHVSGVETGDVIPNCKPLERNCRVHWSNVRVVSSRHA